MTDDRNKKPTIAFWTALAFVPLVVWIAAYLVLVRAQSVAYVADPMGGPLEWATVAEYGWPWSDEAWKPRMWTSAFSPLNALDRKARPKKWEPVPQIDVFPHPFPDTSAGPLRDRQLPVEP